MRRSLLLFCLLIALLATSAFQQRHRSWQVGEKGPKGQLVMYVVEGYMFDVPIFLEDDYGVLIANDGDEKRPLPRFVLANRKAGKILSTSNLSEFKQALSMLPKTAKLRPYDTCTIARRRGLPQKTIDAYFASLRRFRILERHITCYCEATG